MSPDRTASVDPHEAWVAFDFETATSDRASACALGVAVVRGGEVVRTAGWLVRPPGNRYNWFNTTVHGITARDTEDAPTFEELWSGEIEPYFSGSRMIAHSAGFDAGVLRATLARYGVPAPDMEYVCSCTMSRRAFPHLSDHRLPTVSEHCGVVLDNHHEAVSDAVASGLIAVACCRSVGAATISEGLGLLGLHPKAL
jgi:DNA polymerase-3 subunit epsilon